MIHFPFVADRSSVNDANDFIARYGDGAVFEAAALADASRDRGNVAHYCRWRQIERMIAVLADAVPTGSVH